MSNLLIGFTGDLLVHRDHPAEAFSDVREVLRAPDILFGNIEGAYTDHPHPAPSAYAMVGAPAHNLDVYAKVGYSVVSMANNHILDMGYEAMRDTRSRLQAQGVKTCGVGDHTKDAHEPAIVEAQGLRIAFLGYASNFPIGYEARSDRPGLAPMRAWNLWRDRSPHNSPGANPLVSTVPDAADLEYLTEDIRQARTRADLVITSFHWGDYLRPFHLTDHETRTARYCIDHGADMVIGHHHHALRGLEWYEGKPIMYGLGNFVFDLRLELSEEVQAQIRALGEENLAYRVGPRKGWPLLPLHEDTRMTLLAWATATRKGVQDIGFLPCRLTPDGLVHPLRLDSAEGQQVISYVEKCNSTQALNGVITREDKVSLAGFSTLRISPKSA